MTHQFGFDLFNIGAGSGGVTGSRRAAAHGARVGNCDDDRVDRACVIRACMWHCCDRVSESDVISLVNAGYSHEQAYVSWLSRR